ncbi:MAG: Hsp70 family protein, partial [Paracoccaceae bacterium]
FGRAGIEAYIEGVDGRLMRGLKSTLGSALVMDRTQVGARAISFRDVIARFFLHLKAQLDLSTTVTPPLTLGRPVHFVDGDPTADRAAQDTLEGIAKAAGFRQIAFQFEPIAAALHYEQTVTEEKLVLIVDIGGGTSDFSVVRVGPQRWLRADRNDDVLGTGGVRVGGTDLDRLLSLAAVMPHLGYNSTTSAGRSIMPRHYYLDLATWHRINTLYAQRVAADLKALRAVADAPEKLDRMIRVIATQQGHGLAMAVEAAKIALSGADAARLHLSAMTGGGNPVVTRATFETAIAVPLTRIADTLSATLAQAGVAPAALSTVFLTGGSAGLPALHALVAGLLPGVPIATGDMLGSVGTGLALDAASRFG